MRSIRKVLLVYKKSYLELHKDHARLMKLHLLPARTLDQIYRSDHENRMTKEAVIRALARRGLHFDVLWRGHLAQRRRYDLIVTVGGDGTFLEASHISRDTPIMAINSDRRRSVALFSAADRSDFEEKLEALLKGRLSRVSLARMEVRLNGKRIREYPMNDILFAHDNPGSMTRYLIQVGAVREEQKSSGVWCSTAAGSTAAVLAAGGRVMPITSRELQYRVREPYTAGKTGIKLRGGIVRHGIRITSLMRKASLFVDGHRTSYPVHIGDVLTAGPSRHPLVLYGYDPARRKRLFG